ncbi:MAG: coenzyme-B sulfoethylthiotransferase subunit gamma [Candidatus Methanomethyliaceae archaeon]|nr:coenzyme-B sulfoethylthiotransferase subunit gamma [Candidatus Methanomethyliaceae archaeon]MDW7971046.1 coenzyme-B sulfoethylthiotransferase subunit gamma [Nitrososphaerota archaeon]
MDYKPQLCPGGTIIAENRRKYLNPDYKLKKIRSISDEEIIKLLGFRHPGEAYKSMHPSLDELGEPECPIRKLVEPTPGAKAGDLIRFVQFTDSIYHAPITPTIRARMYHWRYRGCDVGALSGRTPLEMRERDLENVTKELLETEIFDPAVNAIRAITVHGHSLRLDENGLMFDAKRRVIYSQEDKCVYYVKDQWGKTLDKPINFGPKADEGELKRRTCAYRIDNIDFEKDSMEFCKMIFSTYENRVRGALSKS